jgi:hypothetical protein
MFDDDSFIVTGSIGAAGTAPYFLRSVLADGTIDPGFGVGGESTLDTYPSFPSRRGDGFFVVNSTEVLAFDRNGTPDNAYESAPFGIIPTDGHADGAGRMVLVAAYEDGTPEAGFRAIRLLADGSLDMTFGTAGLLEVPLLTASSMDEVTVPAFALAASGDGIVLTEGKPLGTSPYEYAYTRLFEVGVTDGTAMSIDVDGVRAAVAGPNGIYYIVTLDAGNIVITAIDHATNTVDTTFGTGGTAPTTALPERNSVFVDDVVGRLVVVGFNLGELTITRHWL